MSVTYKIVDGPMAGSTRVVDQDKSWSLFALTKSGDMYIRRRNVYVSLPESKMMVLAEVEWRYVPDASFKVKEKQ